MSESGAKGPKEKDVSGSTYYADLARVFLRDNDIPLNHENLFKAEVLFEASGREKGQIRISAVKVLLEWSGQLKRKSRDDEEESIYNFSTEEAIRLIFRNLKEMGITKEQVEKWIY